MPDPAVDIPPELLAGLFLVEDELLVQRHLDALVRIGARTTGLKRFHVDRYGYSPEVARELSDPDYLGQGPDHPFFVILTVDQLRGPSVQPNAGFGASPYGELVRDHVDLIARLALTEPLFGEFSTDVTRFASPAALTLVDRLWPKVQTPSGRIDHGLQLTKLRRQLLESDHGWHDERLVDRMLDLAGKADGLVDLPAVFRGEAIPATPAFVPSFGGCYVFPPEPGGVAATVLAAQVEPEELQGRGSIGPLTVESALEFLSARGFVELEAPFAGLTIGRVRELQTWIAAKHLADSQWDLSPEMFPDLLLSTPILKMRGEWCPPSSFLELDEVLWKIRNPAARLEFERLSPLTRLRILAPTRGDPRREAIVRHLQAFLDHVDLSRAFRDAPDLLFSRFDRLHPCQRTIFQAWLSRREVE
ncbi:MAG: hypothetical protein HY815_18860 [Candidatus Riflebacteria bacterium]|nr:hypothetical protein [Candidatus Riflebacteria bacterium]